MTLAAFLPTAESLILGFTLAGLAGVVTVVVSSYRRHWRQL